MSASRLDDAAFTLDFSAGIPLIQCHMSRRDVTGCIVSAVIVVGGLVLSFLVLRSLFAGGGTWYPDGGSPGETDLAEVVGGLADVVELRPGLDLAA
jgi:hypothetical protein